MEKPSLKSKFFPAKIPAKIKEKFGGKNLLCK
jgi:hypothetical protein